MTASTCDFKKTLLNWMPIAALMCVALLTSLATAGESSGAEKPAKSSMEGWDQLYQNNLNDISSRKGAIDLVFIGDSITDRWRNYPAEWNKYWSQYKAINLGIGGDSTQNVLWRLQHGELNDYHAKLFVVMIGTNNSHPEAEVANGIKAILDEIKAKQPQANILLLGIFPRGEKPTPNDKNANINKLIAKFEDDVVHFMDITNKLLEPDGSISTKVMWDHLHMASGGFDIWGRSIEETVKELLVSPNVTTLAGPGPYKKLAALAAQVKTGTGFGKVLKTLTQKMESKDVAEVAEAKMMFDALQGGGQRNLDTVMALKETKPLLSLPRFDRIAAQFAGHEIGIKAKSEADALRKDPKITQEIKAEEAMKKLQVFEGGFAAVNGVRDPKSPQFIKLNLAGMQTLIGGCQQLIKRYPGTMAAEKAEAMMNKYR